MLGTLDAIADQRASGLTVVTTNIQDATALVGAFRQGATLYRRGPLRVEMSNSNEDDFRRNLVSVRAEFREALVIHRAAAFQVATEGSWWARSGA